MNLVYELYIRHEVYEALTRIRRSDRQRVLNFIESLMTNPFDEGDYKELGSRDCQVKVIGRLAVYYRSDHADKEVRIVDLIDADLV